MGTEAAWQAPVVEELSRFFRNEPAAKAFVLCGSLAAGEIRQDRWSDIDACIVVTDRALARYYLCTGWLQPLCQVVGLERHEHPSMRTLRVCLEDLRRLDLTFISESALNQPSLWARNPFYPSFVVFWSELPGLEMQLASLPQPAVVQDLPRKEIEAMVDAFWLREAVATTKVARNDLLIGLPLALDLARDCLLLQMMRRDRKKGTRIHRTGGWGNELASRFSWDGQEDFGAGILALARATCEALDELVPEWLPDYESRGLFLFPSIESAKTISAARAEIG
jgi:hypothetical protein